MSLTLKNITLKNFLSIGAVCQAVNFDQQELTLILGENLDLGGDGARNGTGKTSLIQALSYALFGIPINNIKKDNLVNRTNGKNMVVTLEFNISGVEYKIVRGRKPNILQFFINDLEHLSQDSAQGDSRETQVEIERVINMSSDMFKHIVALNTYSEPFLAMRANDQRNIIEQLLGITLLSEKAETIKNLIKESKDNIQQEEYKVRAIEEANKRIIEQIEGLARRQRLWVTRHQEDVVGLQSAIDELLKIDITSEIQAHAALDVYNQRAKDIKDVNALKVRAELDLTKESKTLDKLKSEVTSLQKHECYACGQDLHDEKHEQVLAAKQRALEEAAQQVVTTSGQLVELTQALDELGVLGLAPVVFYDDKEDAIQHRSSIQNLQDRLAAKVAETDPYSEQISDMENQALQAIDFDKINQITKTMEHQKFLLDLLTSKDSFVRKKIIDQNLSFLNSRLTHYLDRIGLPHQVVFLNDLSVEITELGRSLDFGNLSRGEANRLILGLSFAFRDVWENLYSPINTLFIDELIDSGLDSMGVENSLAVLKSMSRTRNKSIWLVSHREELAGRVHSVLRVTKENGFTTYSTSTEME
jgi:DNA repair exonuclease SbcCD ATPase subunit